MLRFYGPVNPMGSCRAQSVYLTTFTGQAKSSEQLTSIVHILSPGADNCPFLNKRKGENDRRKYFMINLHKRMLPTSAGVEPATSWSPFGRALGCSDANRSQMSKCMTKSSIRLVQPAKTQTSMCICAVFADPMHLLQPPSYPKRDK